MYITREILNKRNESAIACTTHYDILAPDNITNYQRLQSRGTRYEKNNYNKSRQ